MRIFSTSAFCVIAVLAALLSIRCDLLGEEDASCSQTSSDVVIISGELEQGGCGGLVKTFELGEVLVKPNGKFYEVFGEVFIDFDNDYYLRGAGITDENCLSPVVGKSPFTVRAVYPSCSEEVAIDILDEPRMDALVLCTFTIATAKDCSEL